MLEKNTTNVKIVYKNFPLRSHNMAIPAASAAMAAKEQGKFWEFHDLIFGEDNLRELSIEKLENMAKKLELDFEKFKKDVEDPTIMSIIRNDFNEARRVEVDSTPTIFVNGRKLKKSPSLESIQELIDQALKEL